MKLMAPVFTLSGILLVAMSFLEQVIVYAALAPDHIPVVNTLSGIRMLVSPYIWSITRFTFWFGVLFLIFGIILTAVYNLKRGSNHFTQ